MLEFSKNVVLVAPGKSKDLPEEGSKDFNAWVRGRVIVYVDELPDTYSIDNAVFFFSSIDAFRQSGISTDDDKYICNGVERKYYELGNIAGKKICIASERQHGSFLFSLLVDIALNEGCKSVVSVGFELPENNIRKNEFDSLLNTLEKLSNAKLTFRELKSAYVNNLYSYFVRSKTQKINKTVDVYDQCSINSWVETFSEQTTHLANKEVFFTLISSGYEWGGVNLIQAIRSQSALDICVLYTSDTDLSILNEYSASNVTLLEVPVIIRPDKNVVERYFNTLSKFFIFSLEKINRAIFIESDLLIRGDLSSLVGEGDDLIATHSYNTSPSRNMIHPCVMSFKPSMLNFDGLIANVKENQHYSGQGDHGYFIDYFRNSWIDCEFLGTMFNWSQTYAGFEESGQDIRIVHLHGLKPWDRTVGRGAHMGDSNYYVEWLENFTKRQLVDYLHDLRKVDVYRECKNTLARIRKSCEKH